MTQAREVGARTKVLPVRVEQAERFQSTWELEPMGSSDQM